MSRLYLLRRVLLIALLGLLALVGGLYVLRQRDRTPVPTPAGELEKEGDSPLVLAGHGFDYELTEEGKKLLHIRADRIVSEREESYRLEQVTLELIREDGGNYTIEGDQADVDLATNQARIEGQVKFRGPSDVELQAEGLELRRRGKLVVSSSPVTFHFLGRFQGSARRLSANALRNVFILAGNVAIDTLPGDETPMSLRCSRLVYERDEKLLRLEGDVELERAGSRLEARRLALRLTEDEKRADFARASWGVKGFMQGLARDGSTQTIELAGKSLAVLFGEGKEEVRRAELEGGRRRPAVVTMEDGTGLSRRIRSDFLAGEFEAGELRSAEASGRVQIDESITFTSGPLLRQICSDTAQARLAPDGEAERIELAGDVQILTGEAQAHGDQIKGNAASGEVELLGNYAWVLNEQGRLEAPKIVSRRDGSEIWAGEPVRAWMASQEEFAIGAAGESKDEPIRIEAREALWSEADATAIFRNQVRAWQGENFLLADELVGDSEASTLTATGKVRTVWRPEEETKIEDAATDLPAEPLEITAPKLVYEESRKLLTYSGGARAVQAHRLMQCQEIQVQQTAGEGFEELICEGDVHVEDRDTGSTVTGNQAVYNPGARTATVTGSPVILRDGRGTEIKGRVLVYSFESATAQMQSLPSAADSSLPNQQEQVQERP